MTIKVRVSRQREQILLENTAEAYGLIRRSEKTLNLSWESWGQRWWPVGKWEGWSWWPRQAQGTKNFEITGFRTIRAWKRGRDLIFDDHLGYRVKELEGSIEDACGWWLNECHRLGRGERCLRCRDGKEKALGCEGCLEASIWGREGSQWGARSRDSDFQGYTRAIQENGFLFWTMMRNLAEGSRDC